jgi:hypothetical protein
MNLKLILAIGAILFCLALSIGFGVKLAQKAEGYKANDDQTFNSFEPHFFIGGCATYSVRPNANEPVKNIKKKDKQTGDPKKLPVDNKAGKK